VRAAASSSGPLLLIEKRQVPHGSCLALRVRQDLMPPVKLDRLVVRVADLTAHVHRGVSPHRPPSQSLGTRLAGQ